MSRSLFSSLAIVAALAAGSSVSTELRANECSSCSLGTCEGCTSGVCGGSHGFGLGMLRARMSLGGDRCGGFACRTCRGRGCGLGNGACGPGGCGIGGRGGRVPSYWACRNGGGAYGCLPPEQQRPDLFYNYWAPNNCGGAMAGMYPVPYAVPQIAGHTYYTYQPFYPHEFMYPHHRTYHSYYDGGRGLTRTHAHWYRSPGSVFSNAFKNMFEIAR